MRPRIPPIVLDFDFRLMAHRRGISSVGFSFWESIPQLLSRNLVQTLTVDLANDSSSGAVRVAAITALKALLENPLALPVLKALLPKISNRIHDTTEKVRLAFIALLERVSSVRRFVFISLPARTLCRFTEPCLPTAASRSTRSWMCRTSTSASWRIRNARVWPQPSASFCFPPTFP